MNPKWFAKRSEDEFEYLYAGSYKKEDLFKHILPARLPDDYSMQLVDQTECDIVAELVNKGIDSHLEACTMSDTLRVQDRTLSDGRVYQRHLGGAFDKTGMMCLIRRLMEFVPSQELVEQTAERLDDDDLTESYGDTREEKVTDKLHETADQFLSCILETLQIEWSGC